DEQLRPLAVVGDRKRLPRERPAADQAPEARDAPAATRAVETPPLEAESRSEAEVLRTASSGAKSRLKPRQVLNRGAGPVHGPARLSNRMPGWRLDFLRKQRSGRSAAFTDGHLPDVSPQRRSPHSRVHVGHHADPADDEEQDAAAENTP